MASSKFPNELVPVPQGLIDINHKLPDVYLNLRPRQRRLDTPEEVVDQREHDGCDGYLIQHRLREYLRSYSAEAASPSRRELPRKFVLLFQGYSTETASTIIFLQAVTFCSDDYPRLDFEHSALVKKVYGCPNFWGAFILAIAPASCLQPFTEKLDPYGSHFVELVKRYGVEN
jgi:hypothetical protein